MVEMPVGWMLLEDALSFLLRHWPIAGRFESGRLERINEPLCPVAAFVSQKLGFAQFSTVARLL